MAPQRKPTAQVSGPYSVPESWAAFRAVDLLFVEPWISFFEPSSRHNSVICASARPIIVGRIPSPRAGPHLGPRASFFGELWVSAQAELELQIMQEAGSISSKSWATIRARKLGPFAHPLV